MDNLKISLRHNRWFRIFIWAILLSTPVFSWGDLGHEVMAQIAWTQLKPNTKKEVNRLLKITAPYYPENRNFVSASKWADLIKKDMPAFDNWHYQDQLSIVITDGIYTLQHSRNNFSQAFMLPMVIHLVADAHQPLHTVNRDQGGNLFKIDVDGKTTNLHLYWDLGLGLLGNINDPYKMTMTVSQKTKKIASEWMKEFPKSYFGDRAHNLTVDDWIKESAEIANTWAFDIQSEDYLKRSQEIIKKQIVLAGYRLSFLLNSTLSKK